VEDFARRVAAGVRKPYHSVLRKVRKTRPQKEFRNSVTKEKNLAGAFEVRKPDTIADRGVLLIDDIWDSGKTFLVVGKTLKEAGAAAVWPLAITRTAYKQDR
jgi:predicted amidophosphoribosyltransferase